MEAHTSKFKARLGMFITGGLALFVVAIFVIGKQRNMFDPVFKLTATYRNISGLQVGNNVRFSGINVGTVDNIEIINDTMVQVDMIIEKDVQKFIKSDSRAGIGSEGIVGDRLVTITQGNGGPVVKDGQQITASEPIETDDIISSLKVSAGNAEIITDQLAEITIKINNGNGILGKLIEDSSFAENINETIENLKKGSKSLDENMEAAKHNFLLRGYFNKKKREEEKRKEEERKKEEGEKNKVK